MPVAIEDPYDTYRTKFPCEEPVGKSTLKADNNVTCLEEKRSLICTKQSQTIENLLPDEEDLFSGVLDELGCTAATNSDDEDSDLFTSNGGIELEENSKLYFGQWKSMVSEGLNTDQSSSDYIVSYEQHPSRTLLVENVDKRVEDSKLRGLFEQHGDIQTFYTTCRCQGFVIISYYDIRAATIALNTLQNKPLENENLHIRYLNQEDDTLGQYIDQASLEVFSSDTSISNDKLHQLFGAFGDIEDIRGTTHHKHIKYYDIRAAEAAINGLSSSNMLQESKLEVNYPKREVNYAREQHGIMQDQLRSCQNLNGNSLPQVVTSCMKDEYIYGVPALLQSSCSFTSSFSFTVGMSSASNQFGYMPYYSTDQAFRPHSLPITCKGVTTYDSLNSETVGVTTGTYDKHLHMLGPYGPTTGHMFWGSTRMMRSALGEHANALSCSNSFQNHHLNPIILSSCPPFNNSVCVHTGSKSMKCSFSRPKGRARRISHGRHGHVSCHTDDKKFELDIERVLRGEDSRTTLMIRNIPNKYSSAMLLAAINEHNQGTYDFIYLPLDFKNKCNMGYAFINMTDPLQIVPFYKSINGKKWEKFHSGKVACLAYARIQGKQALIANFQESSLMNQDKCCHPILFTTDGPNAGNQEPFPLGPKIHSRRYKNRCNTHKRNENQEISSTSSEGESYYRI
ncbi:putative RNA recognition motif domain, mei2/Mei2-like RNA recognition [Helianthus annuus]|nr:putative RNA recognition motif domain, mei2/Mei2-like RNA recognition [Helianthus annuus]